jgi:hypothetical protein
VKLTDFFKKISQSSKYEMRNHLLAEIKKAIEGWDKSDIYAVSLFVYDRSDNPFEPTVTLGYNTEENYRKEIPNAWDEAEARWNYAFWLQNNEYYFGVGETQPIVKQWIESKGYRYYTYDEVFASDQDIPEEAYEGITEAFVEELILIVRDLHDSGFIRSQFGKDVPVLIHELEYYDEIAKQNLAANPHHIMDGFVRFCIGG